MLKKSGGSLGQQMSAETLSFEIAPDVQVIDKGSPSRVVVEHDVGEAEDLTITIGDHGVLVQPGRSKTARPDLEPVGDDVSVKIRIQ
jgi:hypothetical protein